ncbi:hypothetical protein [Amycolatopsis sp. GA6-003]|uniref:hypothetical protein n=1 Tax=Amycolatopsis sp. GA6-003 TaxID=2652444 RepID=UPI0039170F20
MTMREGSGKNPVLPGGWMYKLVRTPGWIGCVVFIVVVSMFRPIAELIVQAADSTADAPHVYPWGLVAALVASVTSAAVLAHVRRRKRRTEPR